jgi:hypothetical protein
MFHIIYLDNNAVIRPANHGSSAIEWEHGCRTVLLAEPTLYSATKYAKHLGFNLLESNEWNEFISSLDDPSNVPSNSFINSRPRPDKWDNSREIY